MSQKLKNLIKALLPKSFLKWIRPYYHGSIALLASRYFGQPSEKLIVIGVTGTKGKTTTINLIAAILEEAGFRTGFASTATYNFSGEIKLNTFKMSTLSGWTLQKWLAQMVHHGCQYAVLEMTSEGLAQNRHLGIHFDATVFTNLTPEHLDSHGNFDNYKRAKGILFKYLGRFPATPDKLKINPELQKSIIVNLDDPNGTYYLNFKAGRYASYAVSNPTASLVAERIIYPPDGVEFVCRDIKISTHLKGRFDVYNSLGAIAAAQAQGVSLEVCRAALAKVSVVPGRMEIIQAKPFTVLVDYAHEPTGMKELYETVLAWPHGRIIHVLGPTGGGRDFSNKIELGRQAGQNADIVIITTDDPYDDRPSGLAEIMGQGATSAGKILGQNYFIELDRRKAIAQAIGLAQPTDLILITGKGSEQKMVLAKGRMIDWDDRSVAREQLAASGQNDQNI